MAGAFQKNKEGRKETKNRVFVQKGTMRNEKEKTDFSGDFRGSAEYSNVRGCLSSTGGFRGIMEIR